MAEVPKPDLNKFEWNLSRRFYLMMNKRPPLQEIDKEDPLYKYKYTKLVDHRVMVPLLKTPVGEIWDTFFTFQGYGFCADIEMSTVNCLEAYGFPQSYRKCSDYLDDLYECMTERKQMKRVELLRDERRRQYQSGEREIKYSPPPPIGTYQW